MKIQLTTKDHTVLYELEKSKLFPNYRTVLFQAITLNTDLSDLLVDSENLEGLVWKGIHLDGAVFKNCSLKETEFTGCNGSSVVFSNCNLEGSVIKGCNFTGSLFSDCKMGNMEIQDSECLNWAVISNNCSNSKFYNTNLYHSGFNTTQLSGVIFKKCNLESASFVIGNPSSAWMQDTSFIECSVKDCDMNYVDDIAVLNFWETKLQDIELKNNTRVTEIINENSKVIFAIDADVLWWKPYYKQEEFRIFRSSVKEFLEEVQNGYPNTDLDPERADFDVDDELQAISAYLESLKQS